MKHDRMVRINRLLQTTLADLIPSELRDPRLHALPVISVAEVRTTSDMRHARVFLSIVADKLSCDCAVDAVQRASGFLRGELGRRLRLRYIPELSFELDQSQDRVAHIEGILRELACAPTADASTEESGEVSSGDES